MRYADSLLTDGEVIVLRTRQHWLALIVRARSAIGLFLLGLLALGAIAFFPNVFPQGGVATNIVAGLGLVLILLGFVIFLYRLWHWSSQDYIVTNRRLLKVTGILNKRSADSSLEKINDAILTQPVLGRMMGYGDLEILTAADMAIDRYHMLKDPKEFKKVMLTQKHALETDYVYTAPPSPPLRAEREPMAPPPMPAAPPLAAPAEVEPAVPSAPAAAPTATAQDASLEVTQTLARLADLRDSGAITPEEYEQKKDELLNRL